MHASEFPHKNSNSHLPTPLPVLIHAILCSVYLRDGALYQALIDVGVLLTLYRALQPITTPVCSISNCFTTAIYNWPMILCYFVPFGTGNSNQHWRRHYKHWNQLIFTELNGCIPFVLVLTKLPRPIGLYVYGI